MSKPESQLTTVTPSGSDTVTGLQAGQNVNFTTDSIAHRGDGRYARLDAPNTFTAENLFTASVGIGNRADPTEGGQAVDMLAVQQTFTTAPENTFTLRGVAVDIDSNFTEASTVSFMPGLQFTVRTALDSAFGPSSIVGVYGLAEHRGAFGLLGVSGLAGNVYASGSGDTEALDAVQVDVANYGTGHSTGVRGIHIFQAFDTGPVTTRIGIDIDDQTTGSAANAYAIRTSGGETRHSTGSPTTVGVSVQRAASQTADVVQVLDSDGTTVLQRTNANGYSITNRNSAPDDAELNPNDCAFWFDPTPGAAKFMIKAKDANGTVVTGSIALT